MKDLTKGNPFRLILLFALPVFLGSVLQQLYNLVDTIIVGWVVNSDAFTGVGLTGSISFLVLGFANGLTSGFGVRVAQRFGAGDKDGVRRAIAMTYLLCAFMAVVITVIAIPCTAPLLRLINTPEQYFDYAYYYLLTIFCGICATVFYNAMCGIMRAIGNSKAPLLFLIIAVTLNIGLDFFFIVVLKMHYIGAALATVGSQFVAGCASLVYFIKRYPELRLHRSDFAWDWKLAGGHIAVGLPMALQFSITAIGCIVQQSALNGLDASYPGAVTAYAAASKIDNLVNQTFPALGTAMATFAGQNYGAGRMDRVKQGVRASFLYSVVGWVFGFVVCLLFSGSLIKLFLNVENGGTASLYYNDIIAYGSKYLLYQSASYLLLGIVYVYRNTLQGIGKSVVTTLAGVFELAGRIIASLAFVSLWEFTGICVSNPVAWLFADVFLLATYFITMRQYTHNSNSMKKFSAN